MHAFPVGWDLISLYKHMPWNDKFFALYLALVVAFSFVRSLRLGRRLWSYFPAAVLGSHDTKPEASDLLAASALANKLSLTNGLSDESDVLPMNSEGSEKRLQIVEAAAPRFQYLWYTSDAKVAGMKNLAVLTFILSGLVLSYDLLNYLASPRIKYLDLLDFAGGPAEMLAPVVLGLAVSAVLYACSSLYEGALARRKAEWNLFVANVDNQRKVE